MSYGIIYCAYNKINGKRYIGQTIKNLQARIRLHYQSESCVYFHRALTKYKKEDWEWTIIDTAESRQELDQKEQYWISFYDSFNNEKGYNLTKGGSGSIGVIVSEEHKRHTRESMLKITENNYKENIMTSIPVKCLETNKIYSSQHAAYREDGFSVSDIRQSIKTHRAVNGYTWIELQGDEKLKAQPNAIYCVELNKVYKNFRQARVQDRFHQGNLSLAMNRGDPYEEKHYAGYTFLWVNPERHTKSCSGII